MSKYDLDSETYSTIKKIVGKMYKPYKDKPGIYYDDFLSEWDENNKCSFNS